MATQDGFQELIAIFDPAGSEIELELPYEEFNRLLAQKTTLVSHADRIVKACYVQIGAGLSVRRVVFFLFKVNDAGNVDPAFNLPLEYMAHHAGTGPDLGLGVIRMACRSQCPVPWHSINMWEPIGEDETHSAMLVQKTVWRNRLGIKPAPVAPAAILNGEGLGGEARRPLEAVLQLDRALQGAGAGQQDMARQVAAFGEAGLLNVRHFSQSPPPERERGGQSPEPRAERGAHPPQQRRERPAQLAEQLREEMLQQQQGYLEQIKSARDEIHKLKVALRHEQERNRRLQQLLRGDV